MLGWFVDDLAGGDVELGLVKRALDDLGVLIAIGQPRVLVGADVIHRVVAVSNLEDGDGLALDFDPERVTLANLAGSAEPIPGYS